jgi:hypothetical protein
MTVLSLHDERRRRYCRSIAHTWRLPVDDDDAVRLISGWPLLGDKDRHFVYRLTVRRALTPGERCRLAEIFHRLDAEVRDSRAGGSAA